MMSRLNECPNKQLFNTILCESEYDRLQRNRLDNLLQSQAKYYPQEASKAYEKGSKETTTEEIPINSNNENSPEPVKKRRKFKDVLDDYQNGRLKASDENMKILNY
jgi:hypothetical protein